MEILKAILEGDSAECREKEVVRNKGIFQELDLKKEFFAEMQTNSPTRSLKEIIRNGTGYSVFKESSRSEKSRKKKVTRMIFFTNDNILLPKTYKYMMNRSLDDVFSISKLNPFSACFGSSHIKNYYLDLPYPSPQYKPELVLQVKSFEIDNVFKDLRFNASLGFMFDSTDESSKIESLLSNAVKTFMRSKITNSSYSVPIQIFEPKTLLYRIAQYFAYFPTLLKEASECSLPVERLKKTMAFVCAGLHLQVKLFCPFICALGETFEAEFSDGSQIYLEHISHKPTTIRLLIINEDYNYSLSGYLRFFIKSDNLLSSNIKGIQKGTMCVKFKGKITQEIYFTMPSFLLCNIKNDKERSAYWVDSSLFVDKVNKLKGVVNFGLNKFDVFDLNGGIYEMAKDDKLKDEIDLTVDQEFILGKELCCLTGSFIQHVEFDNEKYWDLEKEIGDSIICKQWVLPSDGRFREDLMWLLIAKSKETPEEIAECEKLSQGWKDMLEKVHEDDKKLRDNK